LYCDKVIQLPDVEVPLPKDISTLTINTIPTIKRSKPIVPAQPPEFAGFATSVWLAAQPHAAQKAMPSSIFFRHLGHLMLLTAQPQPVQKAVSSCVSFPHFGHKFMSTSPISLLCCVFQQQYIMR
jgi:hypothetical protein